MEKYMEKDNIKGFKACSHYVVLKLEKSKLKLSEGGIIIPDIAQKKEDKWAAYVFDIGPKAEVTCKIGDRVVFNQYDAKALSKDGSEYIVCQDKNIMAIY